MDQPDPAASDRVYVGPKSLPAESAYRTLETETVRLAPEIDPRQSPTQPSLSRAAAGRHGAWWMVGALVLVLAGGLWGVLRRPESRRVAPQPSSRGQPTLAPVATVQSLPSTAPTASASALVPRPRQAKVSEPPRPLF